MCFPVPKKATLPKQSLSETATRPVACTSIRLDKTELQYKVYGAS